MFVVTKVYPPGWIWTLILVDATKAMRLDEERLGWDKLRAPQLQHWSLDIKVGDSFSVNLPKSKLVAVGDHFTLTDLKDAFAIKTRWARTPNSAI